MDGDKVQCDSSEVPLEEEMDHRDSYTPPPEMFSLDGVKCRGENRAKLLSLNIQEGKDCTIWVQLHKGYFRQTAGEDLEKTRSGEGPGICFNWHQKEQ